MMAAKKSAPKASKPKKPVAAKSVPAPAKSARKAAPPARKPAKAAAAVPASKPAGVPAKSAAAPARPANELQKTLNSVSSNKITAPVPRNSQVDAADDADASDNLLSGPRNVQPYVVKRGEQYMSKEQHEHFRRILLDWKRDLMMEVDRTVSHMKDEAANFPDPNDRATQEEEFSLELRTRDRERKLIRKIDEALARIEDGSYGYCLETGEQIGVKRLEARPVATLSIEAQERRERREKQYGDRDDRYR
jgi:DnaK suppressor protein